MLIAVKVLDEPDFYPYQIEVDALPPPGTIIEIDDRVFALETLTLRSGERPSGHRSYYELTLRPAGAGASLSRPASRSMRT
jgi:hypothetical protein